MKFPVVMTLVFLPGLFSCSGKNLWHQEQGYRWKQLRVVKTGKVGFTAIPASQTGIRFSNRLNKNQITENRNLLNGSGVALGDINGDGWVDIYFCRLDGPNVLYKNLGDWKFRDITTEAGVACTNQFSTGATFADIDGDDDLDLLVTALGGPNACFLNDGHGRFTEATEEVGLNSHSGSTTLALADIDGDGDLDLYMTNYKVKVAKDIFRPEELTPAHLLEKNNGVFSVAARYRDHFAIEIKQGKVIWTEVAEPDQLFLNDGHGHFRAVAFNSGRFQDEQGNALAQPPRDWGLMARFHDLDNDGDPDIYVCNDYESPDRIWINDGKGFFRAIHSLAIRHSSASSMAVDFSDIDADGDWDFFVAEMLSRDHRRRVTQMGVVRPEVSEIGEITNRPQYMRNTLFVNRGDQTFAEIAYFSGVAASEWTWSAIFVDINLDGYEDLLATTGHIFDINDADMNMKINQQIRTGILNPKEALLLFPPLKNSNFIFKNQGDWTFVEVSKDWGFQHEDISHGMALADLDNDGDLDLVVNRFDEEAGVYRNESDAPRIAVRLRGRSPNTQAIGAKIRVLGGPVPQMKEVICGGQYLSGSDPMYVFAAGHSPALTIEVTWRNGQKTLIQNVKPNRMYEIWQSPPQPKTL